MDDRRLDPIRWPLLLLVVVLGAVSSYGFASAPPDLYAGFVALTAAIALIIGLAKRAKRLRGDPLGLDAGILLICSFALSWRLFGPPFGRGDKASACVSGAKRLALAAQMYASDFDDHLPLAANWRTVSETYVSKGGTGPIPDPSLRCEDAAETWTYAINRPVCGMDFNGIQDYASTVMIFESAGAGPDIAGGQANFYRRHTGNGTIAFADAHVSRRTGGPGIIWQP
jgi:prepilin-type processing-associated H-X9-DG protein